MNARERSFIHQWAPCVGMLLLSLLSYADRSVLAILSPTILADLHMTATQYGYAVSVFSVCYGLANPMWGFFIDRKGVWVTILVAVSIWSLASGSHALMYGAVGMCVARGVLGFGEGATFPAGLATVAETLPPERRSFGLGVAYSGGSLGNLIAPLIIVPIALHYGWRATFGVTAVMGLVWVMLWVGLRSSGMYAPHVAAVVAAPVVSHEAGRWNRDLFATVAIYGLGAAPLAFALYAAPLYLSRVLHVSQASLGHLLWIPPAGWETAYLLCGWLMDKRHARGIVRRPVGAFVAIAVAGFLILLAPEAAACAHPVAATMVLFYVQTFLAGAVVVVALSDGMSVQPKEHSGFLAGTAISSWAFVTGVVTPMLGHFFDRKAYQSGFWMVACLPVVGVVLWQVLRSGGEESKPWG